MCASTNRPLALCYYFHFNQLALPLYLFFLLWADSKRTRSKQTLNSSLFSVVLQPQSPVKSRFFLSFTASRFRNPSREDVDDRVCAFANPSASGVDCSWVRWNLDRQRPQKRTKSLCKIFPTHTGFSLFSFSPSHRLFFIEEKIFSTLALSLSLALTH